MRGWGVSLWELIRAGERADAMARIFNVREGFTPEAFIEVQGGRKVPSEVLKRLNAVPLAECMGAEFHPGEIVMWVDV